MNKKTVLAAALLGATVGAQAEQTTQIMYPYGVPFGYAPVVPVQVEVNEDLVKAYVAYQRKAYEHFLAYQQQVRANTPEILRIPTVPQVPAFDARQLRDLATMSERMRDQFPAAPGTGFQPQLVTTGSDIEQTIAEREQQLEDALAAAQERLDERQKVLDAAASEAKEL